ncbi:flagellar hook-basal body protein [Salirhabdus salicampi]|uniref:flagellar hook-basal body protein n=1 Tax=Salirhabdus salicampi TaxID=476102 RepID=UPI0020C5A834|nr:flagellar hook-basal body protein [Salirhabdus salicampi]MCP8617467.1 flagellar hook-basal body protein [Salirhabdus salicampi]
MRNAQIASTTMGQLQKKMDLIGHNLANANTTGYKAKTSSFSSLLMQQLNQTPRLDEAPRQTPTGIRQGTGARLSHTNVNTASGVITPTNRPLDAAIENPKHFFQIAAYNNGETETHYTRSGNFYLQPINDETVALVTAEGTPVIGDNGPIQFNDNFEDVAILNDGSIQVTRNGQPVVEGRLEMVEVTNPRTLEPAGDNSYRFRANDLGVQLDEVVQAVQPIDTKLIVGSLEGSNVDMGAEMTDLMQVQRAYQFNAQSINLGDQMFQLVNQLR